MKLSHLLRFLIITLGLFLVGCTSLQQPLTNQKEAVSQPAPTLIPPTELSNQLDLSNQKLEKVPGEIFNQKNLQVLNVSNNRLTGALPSEIRNLVDLRTLDASDNLMTGIPAEIGRLKNLEILDLSNNSLTGLPNELGNLQNLKILNLSGNDYSTQDLEKILENLPSTTQIIK